MVKDDFEYSVKPESVARQVERLRKKNFDGIRERHGLAPLKRYLEEYKETDATAKVSADEKGCSAENPEQALINYRNVEREKKDKFKSERAKRANENKSKAKTEDKVQDREDSEKSKSKRGSESKTEAKTVVKSTLKRKKLSTSGSHDLDVNSIMMLSEDEQEEHAPMVKRKKAAMRTRHFSIGDYPRELADQELEDLNGVESSYAGSSVLHSSEAARIDAYSALVNQTKGTKSQSLVESRSRSARTQHLNPDQEDVTSSKVMVVLGETKFQKLTANLMRVAPQVEVEEDIRGRGVNARNFINKVFKPQLEFAGGARSGNDEEASRNHSNMSRKEQRAMWELVKTRMAAGRTQVNEVRQHYYAAGTRSYDTVRKAFDHILLTNLRCSHSVFVNSNDWFVETIEIIDCTKNLCLLFFEKDKDEFLRLLREAMEAADRHRSLMVSLALPDEQYADMTGGGSGGMFGFQDEFEEAPGRKVTSSKYDKNPVFRGPIDDV